MMATSRLDEIKETNDFDEAISYAGMLHTLLSEVNEKIKEYDDTFFKNHDDFLAEVRLITDQANDVMKPISKPVPASFLQLRNHIYEVLVPNGYQMSLAEFDKNLITDFIYICKGVLDSICIGSYESVQHSSYKTFIMSRLVPMGYDMTVSKPTINQLDKTLVILKKVLKDLG